MKISIITPTFNSSQTITENIRSIQQQDFLEIEHIIIDGGSEDKTISKAVELYKEQDKIQFVFVSEKDNGIADAFNKGIEMASGEVIGILNSDDFFLSNTIISQVMEAFKNPDVEYVHGDIIFEDHLDGSNIRAPRMCSVKEAMPFNHPAFFVRESIYQTYGKFKLHYKYAMDFEFVCRFYTDKDNTLANGVYIDTEPMVLMRAGGGSDVNETETLDEVEKALKEHGKWDKTAVMFHKRIRFRIMMKRLITLLGLNCIVRLWRKKKWGNELA